MNFSRYGRKNVYLNLKNEDIKPEYIPEFDGKHIWRFACSLDFYKYHGSFKKCAEISEMVVEKVYRNQKDELTLTELRTELFFHFRASRFTDSHPDQEKVKILLELIKTRVEAGKLE